MFEMAEDSIPEVKADPFVTITLIEGRVSVPQRLLLQTNLAPEMRPMINWMLDQAKLTVLTTFSDQEKSKNGQPVRQGWLARMDKRHG